MEISSVAGNILELTIGAVLIVVSFIPMLVIFGVILFLIGWLCYKLIREYIIESEHMGVFMIICAVASAIMLYWAYVDKNPAWLGVIGFVALLVIYVIFVYFREHKTRQITVQYLGTRSHESSYTTGGSAKIELEKIGTGYEGKVIDYSPVKTHYHTRYDMEYLLPNGKRLKFHPKYEPNLMEKNEGKFGILTYELADVETFYSNPTFSPYDDQEEGEAIFKSQKRK